MTAPPATIDLAQALRDAEARERQAADQAAYWRGYADALRDLARQVAPAPDAPAPGAHIGEG